MDVRVEKEVLRISPRLPALCGRWWYHSLRQEIMRENKTLEQTS